MGEMMGFGVRGRKRIVGVVGVAGALGIGIVCVPARGQDGVAGCDCRIVELLDEMVQQRQMSQTVAEFAAQTPAGVAWAERRLRERTSGERLYAAVDVLEATHDLDWGGLLIEVAFDGEIDRPTMWSARRVCTQMFEPGVWNPALISGRAKEESRDDATLRAELEKLNEQEPVKGSRGDTDAMRAMLDYWFEKVAAAEQNEEDLGGGLWEAVEGYQNAVAYVNEEGVTGVEDALGGQLSKLIGLVDSGKIEGRERAVAMCIGHVVDRLQEWIGPVEWPDRSGEDGEESVVAAGDVFAMGRELSGWLEKHRGEPRGMKCARRLSMAGFEVMNATGPDRVDALARAMGTRDGGTVLAASVVAHEAGLIGGPIRCVHRVLEESQGTFERLRSAAAACLEKVAAEDRVGIEHDGVRWVAR
ncbi:MAG TPA: hypothetical protein VK176_07635 [Phycisphaerales bacterium]|nr:hypothetical protein [Phycisphaerales bacterium]